MSGHSLILSPHDDDAALFCAFTAIRERSLICTVLDSWIQPNRGEHGCSAQERAIETDNAAIALGCGAVRMGLRDDNVSLEEITDRFQCLRAALKFDKVYAPAVQSGNRHHDWVGLAALSIFGQTVRQYTTYSRTHLYTTGRIEIAPTSNELQLKAKALECYPSQWRINRPHFEAVLGKSEWLF